MKWRMKISNPYYTKKKMKMFKFLSIAVSVAVAQYNPVDPVDPVDPVVPGGISCWHCDAANMTHCMDIGMEKPCPENAQSCMVEARKRGGQLESVSAMTIYMQRFRVLSIESSKHKYDINI